MGDGRLTPTRESVFAVTNIRVDGEHTRAVVLAPIVVARPVQLAVFPEKPRPTVARVFQTVVQHLSHVNRTTC